MKINLFTYLMLLIVPTLVSCQNSEVLAPEPSVFDLDSTAPTCGGLTSVSLSAGPSLALEWTQAGDLVSESSKITYSVFMREGANSYDLVSPTKIIVGATSTLISSGISVGQTYTLFVQCQDEAGNSFPSGPINELSISVSDSLAPSQIVDLDAGSPTYTSILLVWSPSDDGDGGTGASAMNYKVFASSTTPVDTTGAPLATVTGSTSYLHSGLNPNSRYYYKVVAVDALGNEATPSNEATNITTDDTIAPTFAGNLSSLSITGSTTTSLDLSWIDATDNVTSTSALVYDVYRCQGSTTCDPYANAVYTTTGPGVTTLSDTGLLSSTVYVYGVRAKDYRNNPSTNIDKKITSTLYSSAGSFYAYSPIPEVNIRMGTAVVVANVVGDATGANAFPDLLVGAPNGSEPGSAYQWTGCVYVFPGTALGTFSSTATSIICQPSPVASGSQNNPNFGWAMAAGDMDADGLTDIIVSNPALQKVYIYRTQNSGGTLSLPSSPNIITPPVATTNWGYGLCVGNSDNVGADDLFIVALDQTCTVACGGTTGTGNIQVYDNTSTAGLFIAPSNLSYTISPTNSLIANGYTIANNEKVVKSCTYGNFDSANPSEFQLVVSSDQTAIDGTTNKDGHIAFYNKTGADTFVFQNVIPTVVPSIRGTQWGFSLTGIQLNSGIQELLVGAIADNNVGTAAGAAYAYTLGKSGADFTISALSDAYYGGTDFNNNAAGSSVFAYDIWGHGDGTQDLVMGAYLDDQTNFIGASSINNGQVFSYQNTSGVLSSVIQQTDFSISDFNASNDQYFGWASCKGDVNNDGYEDVMISAPYVDYDSNTLTNNGNVGAVLIYYGKEAGETDFANPSHILYGPGSQGSGLFGSSCIVMDYNGDGSQDLLVGSRNRNVGGIGGRGSVFIYYGATNSDLPTANSSTLNSPAAAGVASFFGWSMAKGDFDNDGYDDLAVGATNVTGAATSSGVVYVFWSNVSTHAIDPTITPTTLEPPNGPMGGGYPNPGGNPYLKRTQQVTNLGGNPLRFGDSMESFRTKHTSLTPVGDSGVDLVVCASYYDYNADDQYSGSTGNRLDLGKCYIYEGKLNGGLAGDYQIMTSPRNEIRFPQGYQTPANSLYFGSAVTKADWDADGVDDLIICADRHNNLDVTFSTAGACFQYKGLSAGGFASYSNYESNDSGNRNSPTPDDVFYNPNGETGGSYFGHSILFTDINNNGTLDMIVGEPVADNIAGPSYLGALSGRVYILRGGW